MSWRTHRPPVLHRFGAARLVAAPIAEHLPREDDHALVPGGEVGVPAELRLQRRGQGVRERTHVLAVGLPLDERPHGRLRVGRPADLDPADLPQPQSARLEHRAGPKALADDISIDHVLSPC
jgi:hypothetical protein